MVLLYLQNLACTRRLTQQLRVLREELVGKLDGVAGSLALLREAAPRSSAGQRDGTPSSARRLASGASPPPRSRDTLPRRTTRTIFFRTGNRRQCALPQRLLFGGHGHSYYYTTTLCPARQGDPPSARSRIR